MIGAVNTMRYRNFDRGEFAVFGMDRFEEHGSFPFSGEDQERK